MANAATNAIKIQALEDYNATRESKSKTWSQLSSSERVTALDAIYPRILNNGKLWRTDKGDNSDYTSFQVGDIIREIDTVNKVSYVGRVLAIPLSLPADFNTSKIELYNQDSKAI